VHCRIGKADDYWSFTIIWRRISHSSLDSSWYRRLKDAQTVTRMDCGFNRWFADKLPRFVSGDGG
jgi:hypothetical protein